MKDRAKLRARVQEYHTSAWGWALSCCKGDKEMAEDDYFKKHDEIQKITDDYVAQCETIFTEKEKERFFFFILP